MGDYLTNEQWQTLQDYSPVQRSEDSLMQAAVAMILRDGEYGTEVLLMQRAFHPDDPWSGQMAFPGGKIEASDESPKAAAMREAHEEVGAELREHDFIGQLDDVYGFKVNNTFSVHIQCYLFKPPMKLQLRANEEVEDMVWLPLSYLNDSQNAHAFIHPSEPDMNMPAVMIDESKSQVLWGLSLRMLSNFHSVLGRSMAVLTESERQFLRDAEQRELNNKRLREKHQAMLANRRQ